MDNVVTWEGFNKLCNPIPGPSGATAEQQSTTSNYHIRGGVLANTHMQTIVTKSRCGLSKCTLCITDIVIRMKSWSTERNHYVQQAINTDWIRLLLSRSRLNVTLLIQKKPPCFLNDWFLCILTKLRSLMLPNYTVIMTYNNIIVLWNQTTQLQFNSTALAASAISHTMEILCMTQTAKLQLKSTAVTLYSFRP